MFDIFIKRKKNLWKIPMSQEWNTFYKKNEKLDENKKKCRNEIEILTKTMQRN